MKKLLGVAKVERAYLGHCLCREGSAFDDVSPFVYMSPIKTTTKTDSF